ncbi:Ig-like domain-containing protein [Myxococcus sp. K15C18031901]|uniref:Ig-like domain-containing protein n=1 Tax=Myxococcus dinghuensis TaxID=2906761 RepID=UPI0020A7DB92|nr:Ig-like domain-containing protein [Myxococcus dinghuensis]MCP3099746.1 Ig-like domain-containing protein [Myxococcus dinghuensis]
MRPIHTTALLTLCAALALTGCDGEDSPAPTPDAGQTDAGTEPDSGVPDAGGDHVAPIATASDPTEGATGVLPVQTFKVDATNTSLRRLVSVSFDEPMDTTRAQVTLWDRTTPSTPSRALTGQWSEDALTLNLSIPRPEADLPPLEEDTRYTLDLTALRDVAGNPLDPTHPGLGDGKLDFTTGERDRVTEHACGHALLEAPVAVTAGASPTTMYPATDSPHEFYALTLPARGGEFLGYSEVVSAERDEPIVMYLDQELPVTVHDVTEEEAVIASTLTPAPAVCQPAITHVLRFTAPAGDRFLRLTYGPSPRQTLHFVFERY